ncbi:MAG: hypothetical protein ACYC66_01590 [Chloroflexota bacterium]
MSGRSLAKILAIAALPLLLGLPGGDSSSPAYSFARKASSYSETVAGWMLENAAAKARQAATGTPATAEQVADYLSTAARSARLDQGAWGLSTGGPARTASIAVDLSPLDPVLEALRPGVELSIQRQVAEALAGQGLSHQVAGFDLLFPPVVFRFEALPKLLVVSPRGRIEQLSTVLLQPHLSLSDAEGLEDALARDGFSALVTSIGGLGVYPSMVPEGSDVRWTLRTVAHEWAHQFFASKPLGWKYAFGAEKDSRMVAVNETAAGILGREIGDEVYRSYYRGVSVEQPRPAASQEDSFRSLLREVRTAVDALLARGKVDEAESFMESSRQALERKGYSLRRLNQAYFAFHGSYSDDMPVGGAQGDDIGGRLHRLREASSSAGEFAWRISSVGGYEDFLKVAPAP